MTWSKIIYFILALALGTELHAAARKYSVTTSITGSTDMKKVDAYDKYADLTGSFTASYKLHRYWSTRFSTSFHKELMGMREERIGNASISLRRNSIALGKRLSFSTSVSALLPQDKKQKKTSSLQAMMTITPSLSYTPKRVPISISYSQRHAKSFHRYETNSYGTNNTSYSISHTGSLSYSPIEKVSFSIYGTNTNRWSYKGSRNDDTYGLGQSISIALGRKGSAEIGHEIGGKTFDYGGKDLDVDLYDSESSTIYLGFSYSI